VRDDEMMIYCDACVYPPQRVAWALAVFMTYLPYKQPGRLF
jgi:hypothetical protein